MTLREAFAVAKRHLETTALLTAAERHHVNIALRYAKVLEEEVVQLKTERHSNMCVFAAIATCQPGGELRIPAAALETLDQENLTVELRPDAAGEHLVLSAKAETPRPTA